MPANYFIRIKNENTLWCQHQHNCARYGQWAIALKLCIVLRGISME